MENETIERINAMRASKPIENPCPRMQELGYKYFYRKGLVDETPHYTRFEEDVIVYMGEKYNIQFNLASRGVVLSMNEDNAECYGGRPTAFLSKEVLNCIQDITETLKWRD